MAKYKGRDRQVLALRLPPQYRSFLERGLAPDGQLHMKIASKCKLYLSMVHSLYLISEEVGDVLTLNQAMRQAERANMVSGWVDPFGYDELGEPNKKDDDTERVDVAIRLTPIFRRFLRYGKMISGETRDISPQKKCQVYLGIMHSLFGLADEVGDQLSITQALALAEQSNMIYHWTEDVDEDEEAYLDRELEREES